MSITTRFQWVKQEPELWLGIVEITGEHGMETFRIKIETQNVDSYRFSHYKFQRFNFDTREWTMDAIRSHYPVDFFKALEQRYFEHLYDQKPENVLITYKAVDEHNRQRRMRIYRYFCKKLESDGYTFMEHQQPTFSALLCMKNKELLSLYGNGRLEQYLDTALARFEFYY